MRLFAPLSKDAYKIGHVNQYPAGITKVYSNFTARSGKHSNTDLGGVIFVGLQIFMADYLVEEWNSTFFEMPKTAAVNKYKRTVDAVLGGDMDVSHIAALHDLGYLPIEIKALPEGSFVPYGVPMFTVENTHPDFAWVTNVIETVLSAECWLPVTSATTYFAYRKLFERYAQMTGGDMGFVPFQGHDFSFRGMGGRHAAAISGFAHLAAGSLGTDTLPALEVAERFYPGEVDEPLGFSVPATEHSVMCAGSKDGEFETFKRLITETYPSGIVSIVSDTWDLWQVLTDFLPRLKDEILVRDGKVVIRPDSGDPALILCGDPNAEMGSPEWYGVIELLYRIFGGKHNEVGYIQLDPHIGAIYGDSITLERAEDILERLRWRGFASTNVVLGIGSYTYQHVTRDTHGMAMKSTYVEINGEGQEIFKDPKTDSGSKRSARGLLQVVKKDGRLVLIDQVSREAANDSLLKTVFKDGRLVKIHTLSEIRARVASNL